MEADASLIRTRHAIQAMRLKDGDELQLSDGRGIAYPRRYCATRSRESRKCAIRGGAAAGHQARAGVRLAKTGHDEQAIDMATQIGVDQVIPGRPTVPSPNGRQDVPIKKWRQVLESATEQSRRSWIAPAGRLRDQQAGGRICKRACVHGDMVIVLHQDATENRGTTGNRYRKPVRYNVEGRTSAHPCARRSEGGISDAEVEAFTKAGRRSVRAGKQHPTSVHRRSGRVVAARASIGTFRLIPAHA